MRLISLEEQLGLLPETEPAPDGLTGQILLEPTIYASELKTRMLLSLFINRDLTQRRNVLITSPSMIKMVLEYAPVATQVYLTGRYVLSEHGKVFVPDTIRFGTRSAKHVHDKTREYNFYNEDTKQSARMKCELLTPGAGR